MSLQASKMKPSIRDRWQDANGAVSLVRPACPTRIARLDAAPEPIEADFARCALLVIDMQNDFCRADGWFPRERGVDPSPLLHPVAPINELSRRFRAIGAPVVFVNWGVRADGANLPASVLGKASACGRRSAYADEAGDKGRILVSGDWGAALVEEIETAPGDIVVDKHRLSGFKDTELDQILRRLGVTTLFFAGINIDRCVFATLMDASFEGYDVVLVEDATATPSPDFVREAILYLVETLYGFTTRSASLCEALDGLAIPSPATVASEQGALS